MPAIEVILDEYRLPKTSSCRSHEIAGQKGFWANNDIIGLEADRASEKWNVDIERDRALLSVLV
jgi:hypothetical protein